MASLRAISDRIVLLPIADATDAQRSDILRIRNQDEVRKNMYTDHVITADEHATWIERIVDSTQDRFFAVIVENEVVGGISLSRIDRANKRAEWAFYLDKSMQGKGVGAALEYRFLNYTFDDVGLQKLNCEVLDFNEKVASFHQRFGFLREGVRRRHLVRDGVFHDTILLGITAEEWRASRQHLEQGLMK